jgi:hypothetical protein
MSMSKCVAQMAGIALVTALSLARAEDQAAASGAASQPQAGEKAKEAPADEIAGLVEQLDAKRFADRQAASEKLAAIGKAAIPALAKAAAGESLERTVRSIELLQKLLDAADTGTHDAAQAALETIAKNGDRPAAARRAQDALSAKQDEARPFPNMPGQAIVIGGAVQLGVGGARRESFKIVNGVKQTEVQENGKTIKIEEDPGKSLKIEVTAKKDGKDVTEKYEAKDADELKQKNPAGYKVYKQYGENQGLGGVMRLQLNAIPGGAVPVLPQPARLRPAQPVDPATLAAQQLTQATSKLKSLGRQLKTLATGENLQKAPQQSKDALKKELDAVKQQLAEIEERLKKDH